MTVVNFFLFFRDVLEEEITDPIGFPDIAKFRLVDMFTACSTPSILKSFSSTNSRLRVVVATVAFGMGIDCSDVRYIYHWSPPSDIENIYKRQEEQEETIMLPLPPFSFQKKTYPILSLNKAWLTTVITMAYVEDRFYLRILD